PLQPAGRIDGLAVAAQLEVERRLPLAARVAYARHRVAARDPVAHFAQQGVVVGVQAHVVVAVVDDHDQAVAGHPFAEHHGAVGHRLHRGSGGRADQYAGAAAAVGHDGAESRQQAPGNRPAEPAHLDRRALRDPRRGTLWRLDAPAARVPRRALGPGPLLGFARGGTRRGSAQLFDHVFQRTGIAAQALLALLAIVVLLFKRRQLPGALAAVAFEFGQLRGLALALGLKRRRAPRDLGFHRVQLLQLLRQGLDAPGMPGL